MDPINILHINTEITWGGGETQTLCLMQGLNDRRYQQFVACQPESAIASRCRKEGIPVHLIKMPSQFSLPAVLQLRLLIRSRNFHIVHCHTSRAHTLGVLASIGTEKIFLVVTRRIEHRRESWWKTKLIYNCYSDAVVAISEAVKDVLLSSGVVARKVRVIPSGVDLKRFEGGSGVAWRNQLNIPHDELVIGYVGKLSRGKGIDVLLRAIPAVVDKHPGVRILIVGEGPDRSHFEALVAHLQVRSHVIFTGFLQDIPGILAAVDVFVLPSLKEAAGGVVREAMAAQKPVVAARVGGIPESVVDGVTGFLVPPGDHESLSRAIIELLNAPEVRERFARVGRERVEARFSLEAMVRQYQALYHELLL